MSLRFILDGYNIINHPRFRGGPGNETIDSRLRLIQLIRSNKFSASPNNKFLIIFDGYSDLPPEAETGNIQVIFSCRESADERIKRRVELGSNPKNTIVVSDDKEIRFFVKSCGAKAMAVEDFLAYGEERTLAKELPETEISFTQKQKINEELRRLWLS